MTTLYLVRHAIAFERGPRWPDDAKRPLTPKGSARMREAVAGLRALGAALDVVITSPLVRAKQTADLIIAGWPDAPALVVNGHLAPGGKAAALIDDLGAYAKSKGIALVGHEPDLGELAARLIGAKKPLVFKKGGVASIEVASLPLIDAGALVWLATPKMLRALADL